MSIVKKAVVATTTGLAALALAGPVSAETAKAVLNAGWSAYCSGNKPMGDCDLVEKTFTNTVDKVKITVTQGNSYCARSISEVYVDGQNHPSRRIGDWQQEPLTITLPPGSHNIKLNLRALGTCKEGVAPVMTGNLLVEELQPDPKVVDPSIKRRVESDTNVWTAPSDQGGRQLFNDDGSPLFLAVGDLVTGLESTCTKQTWCSGSNPKIPLPGNRGWFWGGDIDAPGG